MRNIKGLIVMLWISLSLFGLTACQGNPDQAPTYDRITAEEAKKIMDSGVGCPFIGRAFGDNWGLPDPTGQSDETFVEVIREIEKRIWTRSWLILSLLQKSLHT